MWRGSLQVNIFRKTYKGVKKNKKKLDTIIGFC